MLTHDIHAWFNIQMIGTICEQFPHLDPQSGAWSEAVAAGSPYRYPLWLARALNSAIYDVKWDYESYRAIARIAVFYVKIAVFYKKIYAVVPHFVIIREISLFFCVFTGIYVDLKACG